MPEISRFLGIVIGMFYREHGVPHFHAVYGESFPPRALRHVLEWAAMHKAELLANWELAREGKPLNRIEPLE